MFLRILQHNSLLIQTKVRVHTELLAEVLWTLACSGLATLRNEIEFLLFWRMCIWRWLFLIAAVGDRTLDALG